jgi:hypothetical protein
VSLVRPAGSRTTWAKRCGSAPRLNQRRLGVFEQMPPAAEELVRRAEELKQEGNELHVNKHYEAAVGKYALAKAQILNSTLYGNFIS